MIKNLLFSGYHLHHGILTMIISRLRASQILNQLWFIEFSKRHYLRGTGNLFHPTLGKFLLHIVVGAHMLRCSMTLSVHIDKILCWIVF